MRLVAIASILSCLLFAPHGARGATLSADETEFFEKRIRPILVENCVACHGDKKQKGALRLDAKSGWEKGGDNGPALVPGKPDRSLLVAMVKGKPGEPPQMPPESVLPEAVVNDLVKWVEMGAPDPRDGAAPTGRAIDWTAAGEHWAFKPVVPVAPPTVKAATANSAVDQFIAAGLEREGLSPVAAADRRTLIRRATFDLTGLPPSEADVKAFEADPSPDGFRKLVDRLLASPQYGEHQARGWLDLARYGEDQADKVDGDAKLTNAWRYRDWVIEAFNRDLPYDRFVKLQLAADLMEGPDADPRDRRALGLLGLGAIYARPGDLDRKRAEEWDDRVDTLTRSFLALTVSCARCHDHKYDPIPTQDYYSLTGIIAGTKNDVIAISPRELIAANAEASAKADASTAEAKAFFQIEVDRLALIRVEKFDQYALAAWEYAARKAKDKEYKPDALAKGVGLEPGQLSGINKYLRQGGGRGKRLESWTERSPPKDGSVEPTPEARELAELFRTVVRENFAKPLKAAKGARNLDIQNDLFGEKGVFASTEKAILATATPEWAARYAKLADAAKAAAALVPALEKCNGVSEAEQPKDLKVYVRGNPAKQGELAPRRFLRIVAGPDAPKVTKGSGRLELADAIADPRNPLTARVMVNRVWQQHFGRGIVASASNFGLVGDRPTHPELLDHLADRFVREGWSVKGLHRAIMLTAAYQRSSAADAGGEERDPENRWLRRMSRRRLTVEAFRDATLAASGVLDRSVGGPSADLDDLSNVRRTVYGKVSRNDLSKLLRLFDFPAPNISADRRTDTILPQQALFLMNSPYMAARARAMALKFANEPEPAGRVRKAYGLAFARQPNASELAMAVRFLSATEVAEVDAPLAVKAREASKSGAPKLSPLTRVERFAQALLASNEFMFVD